MFKLKYKMHRLVNLIFYFIIFAFGFICGIGGGQIEQIKEIFMRLFDL